MCYNDNGDDMEKIKNIIKDNNNIPLELKSKIFECSYYILNKYQGAYDNLCKNLSTIKIYYLQNENKDLIINFDKISLYNSTLNTLYLPSDISQNYHALLAYELISIASTSLDKQGFVNTNSLYGCSLNKGMNELLTRKVLKKEFPYNTSKNDINNVILFSNIVPMPILTDIYFNKNFIDLMKEYYNRSGSNNLITILENMDLDYNKRVKANSKDNEIKDKYITLLVEDVSCVNNETENEVDERINNICSFIRSQYNILGTPQNIKQAIEKSINKINDDFIVKKGKIHE